MCDGNIWNWFIDVNMHARRGNYDAVIINDFKSEMLTVNEMFHIQLEAFYFYVRIF